MATRLAAVLSLASVMWVVRGEEFLGRFARWDGGWYLWVSREGYPSSLAEEAGGNRLAFFPALPMLHRAVRTVTGFDEQLAAVLVAWVLAVAAVVAVWVLARDAVDRRTADAAALVFACSPAAFVLGFFYTESLLVVAACVALVALRRRLWWVAGLAALVAGVTRVSGLAVVATVVLAGVVELVRHRRIGALWAVVLAPLGFVAWTAFLWERTGDPIAYSTVQVTFGNDAAFLTPAIRWFGLALGIGGQGDVRADLTAFGVVAAVVGLVCLWVVRRRIPWTWWPYTVLIVIFSFSSEWPHNSLRYLLPAVPVFVAVALLLPRRWLVPWVVVSTSAMLAMQTLTIVGPGEFQAITP